MEANKRRRGIYERFIKRALDMILSGIAIIILSPILLIVAILVKTKPVSYTHLDVYKRQTWKKRMQH